MDSDDCFPSVPGKVSWVIMRAIVIRQPGGPEVLEMTEVEDPVPGPGELLVQVAATALNRADILQRMGLYPPPKGVRADIPGLEFSGFVLQSNDPERRFLPGDRVMGLLPGEGYAEKIVLPSTHAIPVLSGMDLTEAAAVPEAFLTAFDALFLQLDIQPGEVLLIHAVGSGVGTAAVQLSACRRVVTIGTSSSEIKLQRAGRLGLNYGINPHRNDLYESVRDKTSGQLVDKILDLVGGAYWDGNLKSLKPKGKLILVGLVGGRKIQADLGILLNKRLTIIGTVLRSRSVEEKTQLVREFTRRVLPLFETGQIKPVIDKCFQLEEAAEAHRYMEENRNFGKIVLQVTSTDSRQPV